MVKLKKERRGESFSSENENEKATSLFTRSWSACLVARAGLLDVRKNKRKSNIFEIFRIKEKELKQSNEVNVQFRLVIES